MPYKITKTSGQEIATIPDGSVDATSTSLTLIGKNYAGYGSFLNENYVKLLENFSNVTAPAAAIEGQLWYDNLNSLLKIYNGLAWKSFSSSTASSTAPTSAIIGDMWWDTVNSQLKVYNGTLWVTIGPTYTSTSGTTGTIVENIVDSVGVTHSTVKFYVSDQIVAIVSDATSLGFTPATTIPGFTKIYPGLNLVGTSALAGAKFFGTATNADKLNDTYDATSFFQTGADIDTDKTITASKLNVSSDVTLQSTSGVGQVLHNTTDKDIEFYTKPGGVSTKALTISGTNSNVSLTNPLALTSGGTGSTTASGARTNLGLGAFATLGDGSYSNITVSGSGTIWTVNAATTSQAGIVQLASNAEALLGTVTTTAVTPRALQAKIDALGSTILTLASNAEVIAGTITTKAVSPYSLQQKVASTSALGLSQLATDAQTQAGTLSNVVVTPSSLNSRTATISRTGLIQVASAAEVNAGLDTDKAVTSANLAQKVASTTTAGFIRIATDVETNAGTLGNVAISPANLSARTATTSQSGILFLASNAEAQTGTVSTKSVVPQALKYVLDNRNATVGSTGLIATAANADVTSGTLSNVAVTPQSLKYGLDNRTASTGTTGLVALASNAEAQTGTVTDKAIVPQSLKYVLDNRTAAFGSGTTGLVALASNAEVQSLASLSNVVTPGSLNQGFKGANQSLATSGYQILPGGLIMNWMQTSNTPTGSRTINFPKTYPNAHLNTVITGIGASGGYFESATTSALTYNNNTGGSRSFYIVSYGY